MFGKLVADDLDQVGVDRDELPCRIDLRPQRRFLNRRCDNIRTQRDVRRYQSEARLFGLRLQ